MKTTYNEIEIEYNEQENIWVFTLRGRERKVNSLIAAKAAIDTPPRDKKDADTFERRKAFLKKWNSAIVEVEVTSMAVSRYGSLEFWVSDNGTRCKVRNCDLAAHTPQNAARVANLAALEIEIDRLVGQKNKLRDALIPFKG